MELQLRRLTQADLEQAFELDRQAFNTPAENRELWLSRPDADRFLGLFQEGRLAAMVAVLSLGQFFGGRSVPMGGVSSVATAPELRGRGLAKCLLVEALAAMRERGQVVSALHPASTRLYRSVGWELAGAFALRRVPAEALCAIPAAPHKEMRRADKDDVPEIRACYRRVARGVNGFLDRDELRWQWLLRDLDARYAYVSALEDGSVDGYVLYRHQGPSDGSGYRIAVDEIMAENDAAARALWRLVGSSSAQVRDVHFQGAPEDPLLLLLPEQTLSLLVELRWMLRIVDAPGAVAARGFPPGVEARVDLELDDPQCAWNQGRFTLEVSGKEARLEPAGAGTGRRRTGAGAARESGAGAIQLDIGSFASLYAGWATTDTLERTGRLHGGSPADRAALDAAFAGPTPWMPEQF